MWPPWLNSPNRFRNTPPPSPSPSQSPLPLHSPSHSRSRSFNFSCSSFKDIQSLLQDKPEPAAPKSPPRPDLHRRPPRPRRLTRRLPRRIAARPRPRRRRLLHLPPRRPPHLRRLPRRTIHPPRPPRRRRRARRLHRRPLPRRAPRDPRPPQRCAAARLHRRCVALPRVFIGGVYIGGADEVRQLHESGELQRLIERLPRSNQIGCDCCGGFRFLMCDECNGSHKVFTEKTGFRSCSSCNANGLIRCPACFFVLPRHTKSLPPQLVTAHKQL
uniref:Uncharacterized protein At5g39865 family n=1 Tax=Cajanus cajan TaxID=3821 RepID=A0A151U179_CAJCA|nr:Uncharacterized protein At5g39865 family [Cajanus cajan]